MTIPNVNVTVQDGAIGLAPGSTDNIQAKIGACSLGTPKQLYSFSDPKALVDTLGTGPLVEAAAHALSVAGGPIHCVPVDSTGAAGSVGTVEKSGSGTATMTPSGSPLDGYDVVVQITADGANLDAGTAAFKYSLDSEANYSAEIAIPSNGAYTIPGTGVTITFANGSSGVSFKKGDRYGFTCTAPGFTTTKLGEAIDALLGESAEFTFVHIVGEADTVADAASVASAVDAKLTTAATNKRYLFALVEVPADTDPNTKAAFASFTSKRVALAVGHEQLTSPITGRKDVRSSAWSIAARISAVPVHEDLGRVRSGPLASVTKIDRDERKTPGLDAEGFCTLRTIVGRPGQFFITAGRLRAGAGSDFQRIQYRRVMDKACRVTYAGLVEYLNDDVTLDKTTGFIRELDARGIENAIERQLFDALVATGNASAASVQVKRDENIASTGTLRVKTRVLPKGYLHFIEEEIGFTNPALQPAS